MLPAAILRWFLCSLFYTANYTFSSKCIKTQIHLLFLEQTTLIIIKIVILIRCLRLNGWEREVTFIKGWISGIFFCQKLNRKRPLFCLGFFYGQTYSHISWKFHFFPTDFLYWRQPECASAVGVEFGLASRNTQTMASQTLAGENTSRSLMWRRQTDEMVDQTQPAVIKVEPRRWNNNRKETLWRRSHRHRHAHTHTCIDPADYT